MKSLRYSLPLFNPPEREGIASRQDFLRPEALLIWVRGKQLKPPRGTESTFGHTSTSVLPDALSVPEGFRDADFVIGAFAERLKVRNRSIATERRM